MWSMSWDILASLFLLSRQCAGYFMVEPNDIAASMMFVARSR